MNKNNCQAQGPTPGPTQGQGQDMVWSWSGQVRSDSNSNSNSNSNVGPELYTKIGFHHHLPTITHTISKLVFSEQSDPKMTQDDT